jgi:hypothetical protein
MLSSIASTTAPVDGSSSPDGRNAAKSKRGAHPTILKTGSMFALTSFFFAFEFK